MNGSDRKLKFNLGERLIEFSVFVIDVVEALPDNRVGNHIAGQLLRSGTAPAPHHGEAQSAESRKDFIHKMKLGLKELRETQVWLRIVKRKQLIVSDEIVDTALAECNELIAIFVSSVTTAKRNMQDEVG
jgi:four helix bundle protein